MGDDVNCTNYVCLHGESISAEGGSVLRKRNRRGNSRRGDLRILVSSIHGDTLEKPGEKIV